MESKTETRNLTMPKTTWQKVDNIKEKYGKLSAQEVIRDCVTALIKGEEHTE
jgi:hypothetical protein